MLHTVYYRFLHWPIIVRILLLSLALICCFGFAIHLIEPKTFPTVFDGIWWAVITTATVGYGDLYPVTFLGRMLGILLVLSGAGILSAYFVSLATATATRQNAFMEGRGSYGGENHIVIIGWNERAKKVIQQLFVISPNRHIVLIDETLNMNPCPDNNVNFIHGKPYHDETLKKANIKVADMVLITADQHKTETEADMSTILILIAVKGMNPNTYCIVEILTEDNVLNAKRAGANEIIQANTQTGYVMMNSLLANGMSETLLLLLDRFNKNHFLYIGVKPEWEGLTITELNPHLLSERKILIGIQFNHETIINPPPEFQVIAGQRLFVISADQST
ncbi:potassium channel family protein [Heyndrickxia ginsengihumi]|uniref:Ion transporter n=1 Tax=Heyndrickxia ginsengihumi TaxID=363870 RepID=A0A0A6V9P8_9BACI|nr:potassium channel family protein [Heyndrickxia ginsengihumi]KHD84281.1 ion transporter [Heyndrickxia ginsengihumi]MBE6184649.1 ion transporter [Bacillus sp. (in: firmicutes)]MCM3023250.1 potassium channel family protein [Heyndrickxia ginsengihumi]NEY20828.1 potassium channel family protein [Heyndrickxia ginsengihumi]